METLFDTSGLQLERESPTTEGFSRIAKAVELMLAARLMLRGHDVCFPAEDHGIDLVVDYRTLVQVKSSAMRKANGRLRVTIDGRRWGERASAGSRKGLLHHDVDVLACYARDSDRWWLIPTDEMRRDGVGLARSLDLTEHLPMMRTNRKPDLSRFLDAWFVFGEAPR